MPVSYNMIAFSCFHLMFKSNTKHFTQQYEQKKYRSHFLSVFAALGV